MTPDLYVKKSGSGPAIVLLHGLFGAGSNLGALARALQESFTVFSPDLPSHGRSAWLPHADLPGMANWVERWMNDAGLTHAHLLGHSLGGKVAMQIALAYPQRVASLIVADIAPVRYSARHDSVFAALEAVAAARCTGREQAAGLMALHVQDGAVIQFLLASLHRDSGGVYSWRFDLEGIRAAYPALLSEPVTERLYAGPVMFIKGGASDYIRNEDWSAVLALFPRASLEVMPACGHWLHVEQPQRFNTIVVRFLAALEQRKLDGSADQRHGVT